ncbi:MAG: Gfo/Idh/MocA family oxidoreductase [Gemmataceae bacterium]|nr:Gfo/Idh/MocA family oxidoreductase [Gemmataceae bacterium]
MSRRTQRRDFLKTSAAAAAGYWVYGGVSPKESRAANEKLQIACVGVGGKGSSDTDQAGGVGQIVALCDVDEEILNSKAGKFPDAKKYADFRKMLTEMGDKIDAVVVSTPDHTHAPAAVMAMKMKKHVYCQKPLTHSVHEARVMRETAAKMGVCTQCGNQGTAHDKLREAVEVVQSGGIGKVTEAHIWTNRPVWPQAPGITARPKETQEVPKYLAWDLWLGPAPERPFHHGNDPKKKRGTYHDFNWRGWWDFGTGALGDMGCHTANLPFMALKLQYPTSFVGESGELNPETYPAWGKVTYEFPARGDMPPCKVTWYEGRKDGKLVHPPEELQAKVLKQGAKGLPGSGSIMVGDKGILFSPSDYGGSYVLLPEDKFKDYKVPEKTLPRNGGDDPGMKREWAEAIKQNKPSVALSNFAYSGLLTEFILLGNVAIRAQGKKLDWDGEGFKITNNADAQKFLQREYRKGWTL